MVRKEEIGDSVLVKRGFSLSGLCRNVPTYLKGVGTAANGSTLGSMDSWLVKDPWCKSPFVEEFEG